MTILSLILGFVFLDDSWFFKPFGRDGAILFISLFYVFGQLLVRWFIFISKRPSDAIN
ncbi:hypothetical protein [Bacillus solimangrovi]|nr:hypothetical protein [Bacillus solimangrovi]